MSAVAWLGFALASERWRPWGDAIRLQYASDVQEYETIARAAPGFPGVRIQAPHADRWVPEWLVGELHRLLPLGLHQTYSLVTFVVLAASIAAVAATLQRLRASAVAASLLIGAFVASAYPTRLLFEAPGMTTDALFVLGLALLLLAFETRRADLLLVAIVVAALGRQNAVPLAPVVAAAIWIDRRWRPVRAWAAPATLVAAAAAYLAAHVASTSFSKPNGTGLVGMTVGGDWGVHALMSHLARCVVAIAVPLALIVVGRLRGKRAPLWAPLAFGLCVVAQALVLAPDWSHAEPRLVGLALPALVVAAAPGLAAAGLSRRESLAVAVGIALASLHHLYAYPATRTSEWAAFVAVGTLLCLSPLRGLRVRRNALAKVLVRLHVEPHGEQGELAP